MTLAITHTKVSGKPAGSDSTRVYGTHWDAAHTLTGTVSNAQLDDMADGTIKGRALGAGTGDATDLTPAQGKTVLGLATSTTDNAVARFDSTAGNTQNSGVIVDDSNNVSGVGTLSVNAGSVGAAALGVAEGIAVTGDILGYAANTQFFDVASGVSRITATGTNASTNGSFKIISARSDGSNALENIVGNLDGSVSVLNGLEVKGVTAPPYPAVVIAPLADASSFVVFDIDGTVRTSSTAVTATVSANSAIGATTLTFASTTGISSGMGVWNATDPLSIPVSTTLTNVTATTVTISNAIVNRSISSGASFTADISGTTMTVSAVASGVLAVGQVINATGIAGGTRITALGTGAGGTGTYTVSHSQTLSSRAFTVTASQFYFMTNPTWFTQTVTYAGERGYPLIGMGQGARISDNSIGPTRLFVTNGPVTFPTTLFWKFDLSSLNVEVLGTDGFILDTTELSNDFRLPSILGFHGTSTSGAALKFIGSSASPVDGIYGSNISRIYGCAVVVQGGDLSNKAIRFDLSAGSFFNNFISILEPFGGLRTDEGGSFVDTLIQVDSPAASTYFRNNIIQMGLPHGFTATGFKIGTSSTNQANIFDNQWQFGSLEPGVGGVAAIGIDSYGSNDTFFGLISNTDANQSYSAAGTFRSGANRNRVFVNYDSLAGAGFTNSGTNNYLHYNGTINSPAPTFQSALAVASGGTGATSGGGQALDNVSGIGSNGLINRSGSASWGAVSVTQHGVAIGAASSSLAWLVGTDGQLVVGQTSAAPIYRTISGDATLAASGALTLATVNSNVGTFGSATEIAQVTVNAKGLATAASNVTITPAASSITGTLGVDHGGTGVANNAASTLTISGNFATTLTVSGTTGVTLPTSGTLATLAGSEAFTNKTYNGNTFTAGTGTLTLGSGKTATISNTLTLTASDNSTLAIGGGGTLGTAAYVSTGTSGGTVPLLNAGNTFSAAQTIQLGSNAAQLYLRQDGSDDGFKLWTDSAGRVFHLQTRTGSTDTDVYSWTSGTSLHLFTGNVKVSSGSTLTLGNAATTGLSAGVLAASTNASIVLTDSTGQAYRIPCII